jgi:hypothetical protein
MIGTIVVTGNTVKSISNNHEGTIFIWECTLYVVLRMLAFREHSCLVFK